MKPLRVVITVGLCILAGRLTADDKITYDDHVRPILKQHCLACHNPDDKQADLDLASLAALQQGSSSGQVALAGRTASSKLLKVLTHEDEPAMPPEADKLPDAQIDTIRAWIQGGMLENASSQAAAKTNINFAMDATAASAKPQGPPPMPKELPAYTPAESLRAPPVIALDASPWAPLAAVSGDECVRLIHTETGAVLGALAFPERTPHVIRFSRNGRLLLVAGGRGAHSGKVVLFDVTTGQRVAEIGEEFDSVLAADISPDGRWVALGGSARVVKIYSTANGKLQHRIQRHTDWITAMAFSHDSRLLASGDRNGGILVWESESGGIYSTYAEHTGRITSLSWRADDQLLASGADDGKLILWDTKEGWPASVVTAHQTKRAAYSDHATGVLDVNFAADGRLVSCGRDQRIVLRAGDGQELKAFAVQDHLPLQVDFASDGQTIVSGDYAGQVKRWAVDGRQLR